MATYTIKNLLGSVLAIPLPVKANIPAYGEVTRTLPASKMDESDIPNMQARGLINITAANDPDENDNTEVVPNQVVANVTRLQHIPVLSPTSAHWAGGTIPGIVVYGTTVVLQFTPNVDEAFRQLKLPAYAVTEPSFHIHWTKTGDLNESGKAVRWQVEYTVYDGRSQNINDGLTGTLFVEDIYDDAGTTTRILHRTADVLIPNVPASYYISFRVQAVTPAGTPLTSEPALSSVDLTWEERINS